MKEDNINSNFLSTISLLCEKHKTSIKEIDFENRVIIFNDEHLNDDDLYKFYTDLQNIYNDYLEE